MSIKDSTGRKLSSPATIHAPFRFNTDIEVSGFFSEILTYLYEVYSILTNINSFIETDTDLTTTGFDTIIVTDTATITLNDNPLENETVIVKSLTVNTVTIDGNGKNIDGAANLLITTQYDNIKLIYIKSQDVWGIF